MLDQPGSNSGKGRPRRSDLAARAAALAEAAKALQASSSRMGEQQQQESGQPPTTDDFDHAGATTIDTPGQSGSVGPILRSQPQATGPDPAAQRYYAQLEQTGQLADVDEHTDLAALSPRITHIRHRDGTIERLGFS